MVFTKADAKRRDVKADTEGAASWQSSVRVPATVVWVGCERLRADGFGLCRRRSRASRLRNLKKRVEAVALR